MDFNIFAVYVLPKVWPESLQGEMNINKLYTHDTKYTWLCNFSNTLNQ